MKASRRFLSPSVILLCGSLLFAVACSKSGPDSAQDSSSPSQSSPSPETPAAATGIEPQPSVVTPATVVKVAGPTTTEPPGLSGPYQEVLALVVGNNRYAGMNNLEGAEADAEAVAKVLKEKYGFKVRSLIGEQATAEVIRRELAALRDQTSSNTDIIIYFAGHGVSKELPLVAGEKLPRRTGFAIPFSQEPLSKRSDLELLRREAIDMQEIVHDLLLWPARHRVVILDCCYSGLASRDGKVVDLKDFDSTRVKQPSVQVITAGLDGQLSVESRKYQRGVFTLGLVDALDDDNLQTLLMAFIKTSQKVINSPEYLSDPRSGHPQYRLISEEQGEFVLLPLEEQHRWEEYVTSSEQRKLYAGSIKSDYGTKTSGDDYKDALAEQDGKMAAAGLSPDEVQRHEARASLGDPISMAILTEYYGSREDPSTKVRAHSYAVESYETGSPYGKFALGRAYEKGYGVEKNQELGVELQKLSGLKDLIELVLQYNQLKNDYDKAKGGDVGSMIKVLSGAKSMWDKTGGKVRGILAGSQDKQVSDGYDDLIKSMQRGNMSKIGTKLESWAKKLKEVEPQTDLQDALLKKLLADVATMSASASLPSQQMQAYEEGIAKVGPVAEALARSLKAGEVVIKGRDDVAAAMGKLDVKAVFKALDKWRGALAKFPPGTPLADELKAKIDAELGAMLMPISSGTTSEQLRAFEAGMERTWPLAEALVDELAGGDQLAPEA